MAVHVRFESLHISLPSSVKQQHEMIKCDIFWKTQTTKANSLYLLLELMWIEEMWRADWLICSGTSKFVARQVASLMKNEQQSQNLLLKVDL